MRRQLAAKNAKNEKFTAEALSLQRFINYLFSAVSHLGANLMADGGAAMENLRAR